MTKPLITRQDAEWPVFVRAVQMAANKLGLPVIQLVPLRVVYDNVLVLHFTSAGGAEESVRLHPRDMLELGEIYQWCEMLNPGLQVSKLARALTPHLQALFLGERLREIFQGERP